MKHDITPELAALFIRKAAALGYEVHRNLTDSDNSICLTAFQNGAQICEFEKSGAVRFYEDNPLVRERKELHNLLLDLKQAHDLYAEAKPLDCEDVRDFRLISAFGNYLLAAKMDKNSEVRFVTWSYDYDHSGVTWGHYFETNYEGAKLDFAVRAGLIDENQLFTKEEKAVLYDACVFRGRNDEDITYDDEKKLHAVMEKVESSLPELITGHEQQDERTLEQEEEHGI